MDKKTAKKMSKIKTEISRYLIDIIDLKKDLKTETNDKKIKKINDKIEDFILFINLDRKHLLSMGFELDDVIGELNEEQLKIINELFPTGTDANSVEIDKIIDYVHKCRIDRVINLEEKGMTYDTNASMEEKTKNRLYNAYLDIGSYMDETGNGIPDSKWYPYYNEYWQYDRDYEATKDKYFTKEEQEIISKSMDIYYKEYVPWFKENHKTRMAIGKSISDNAKKLDEWVDKTLAINVANSMKDELFTDIAKELNPEYNKEQIKEESKKITREFLTFITDNKQIEEIKLKKQIADKEAEEMFKDVEEQKRAINEVSSGVLSSLISKVANNALSELDSIKEDYSIKLLGDKIGLKVALFFYIYNNLEDQMDNMLNMFSPFTFEDLGLE